MGAGRRCPTAPILVVDRDLAAVGPATPRYMPGVVKPQAASPDGATAISPPLPPSAPDVGQHRVERCLQAFAPIRRMRAQSSWAATARMKYFAEPGGARPRRRGRRHRCRRRSAANRRSGPSAWRSARRSRWRRRHGRAPSTATAPIVPYLMSASNAAAARQQLVELAPPLGRSTNQSVGDLLQALLAGEIVGALVATAGHAGFAPSPRGRG